MPLTTQQKAKLRAFRRFKANPTLAQFLGLQEMKNIVKQEAQQEVHRIVGQVINDLVKEELKQKTSVAIQEFRTRTDKEIKGIVFKAARENILKGVSMIKGEKGDTIIGPPGKTPIAGIDFPSTKQITKVIQLVVKKLIKLIPKPKDGHTPIAGVDFLLPEQGKPGKDGINANPKLIIKELKKFVKATSSQYLPRPQVYLTQLKSLLMVWNKTQQTPLR